jgi:serine protease Do
MSLDILLDSENKNTLSGKISGALVEMVEQIHPSVVQVKSSGRGGGAGVIWRTNGAIVTTQHVVGNHDSGIEVTLADGRTFEAQVIARDSTLDLALLQIEAQDLAAAPVADSSITRVGEMVIAIGHPWGIRNVVTAGIVSGLGTVTAPHNGRTAPYIRSDVVLAPGNSGGPLLNAEGAVIGINAMIFGGDLSVAIPSHIATEWVAGLPSKRVYLGVGVQAVELPASMRRESWSERQVVLLVVSTEQGGLADKHGVMIGDLLLDIEDSPVDSPDTLRTALARNFSSESLRLGLLRGGSRLTLEVRLEQAA